MLADLEIYDFQVIALMQCIALSLYFASSWNSPCNYDSGGIFSCPFVDIQRYTAALTGCIT